jgi:hypothetical protein
MTHWNHLEPFFKPLTVGSPPQLPLSNPYNNFTKTYVQKRKQEKPKTERVIQVDKESTEEAFTLCLSMVTSKQKLAFQLLKDGLIPLKIQSFLCFHMHQHARMTTTIKHGPLKLFLAAIRTPVISLGFQGIWR